MVWYLRCQLRLRDDGAPCPVCGPINQHTEPLDRCVGTAVKTRRCWDRNYRHTGVGWPTLERRKGTGYENPSFLFFFNVFNLVSRWALLTGKPSCSTMDTSSVTSNLRVGRQQTQTPREREARSANERQETRSDHSSSSSDAKRRATRCKKSEHRPSNARPVRPCSE